MKQLVLAASLALAVTVPAAAQDLTRDALGGGFASDSQIIPVMVNNPGLQGATFQSWVALMNPTASRFTVTATFYDTAGTATTRTIDLAAGELKTYPNFVNTVFGVTGAGAVKLTAPESAGGSHNNRFIVSTEVYTATGGRFGTMVPAQEFAATASRSFAAGIGVNATTRSNVGCFDQSGEANTITARVFDNSGAPSSVVTFSLAANAWGQAAITAPVANGYVRFEPTGAASCYAVAVDNGTNAGRFIEAVEYTP